MHSFIRSPILLTVEPRYRQYVEKGWSTEPLGLMGVEPGGSELGGVLGEGGDSGRLSIMLTIIKGVHSDSKSERKVRWARIVDTSAQRCDNLHKSARQVWLHEI